MMQGSSQPPLRTTDPMHLTEVTRNAVICRLANTTQEAVGSQSMLRLAYSLDKLLTASGKIGTADRQ